jgi:hypothetical protein
MKAVFFPKESLDLFVRVHVKLVILSAFLLFSLIKPDNLFSQTTPLSFTTIPINDPDIISPGRGAEQWHNGKGSINYPLENMALPALDAYYRFTWNRLEGASQGSYDWNYFDGLVKEVINKGQKLSFGIMTCYPDEGNSPGTVTYDNGNSAYPEYLHQLMQSEPDKDWKTTGTGPTDGFGSWVPNWNSKYYLDRLKALHEALYAHIKSSSYTAVAGPNTGKTIAYKDAIFSIDIRGYGSWGEWHSAGIIDLMTSYPAGRRPTAATLKTIIDHHVNVFTDHPLSIMISTFDAEQLPNTDNPKEVTAYALEKSNNWGKLGWRRDNWGAIDVYLDRYLKGNSLSFGNSGPFSEIITERWKYAPVTGEPPSWVSSLNGCGYDDLVRQVREYHATSVGNGNYGSTNLDDCAKENIRNAFKATGYRLILEGGSISGSIKTGAPFVLALNWKNIGIAPTYEKWDVVFELKDSSDETVWSGVSQFSPGPKTPTPALLPSTTATTALDNFTLPAGISPGNYNLNLIIKDPTGYRAPLPLAITGRNTDGSYTLRNIKVDSTTASPVEPPVIPPAPAEPPAIPPTVPPATPPPTPTSPVSAVITSTQNCDGQPFDLVLTSATGAGPFDLTINGNTYYDVPVGGTITTIADEKIWSVNPTPQTYEDSPVELGVKFSSSVAGLVKGIRFFSANNISGEYTGHLWSADGTLLASATFTNVSVNGWQEVLFSEPVNIEANTIYVASYHTPSGIYAATAGGLNAAVYNGSSLTALSNDSTGGNGVYSYDDPGFPTNTHNATNYWVDVIFSTGTSSFSMTSVTDAGGNNNTGDLQTLIVSSSPCAQQRSGITAQAVEKPNSNEITNQPADLSNNNLAQNFPNPFNSATIISFSLAKPAKVNLSLFDMNGRLVKVLVNADKEAGTHTVRVNAGSLGKGLYIYKLQAGDYSAAKRMLIQ